MPKKFFTTQNVADFCGVAHTTVIRWISEGKLNAYETPGGHRRIPLADVLAFMKSFNVPLPAELIEKPAYILVADDEKQIGELVKKSLERLIDGVEVRIALSGVEALMMIGKETPGLLIMDIMMPDMDGIQVCRQLRENSVTRKVPIIAMSGKKLTDEQKAFIEKNTSSFVKKPLSPSIIAEKAKELLFAKK